MRLAGTPKHASPLDLYIIGFNELDLSFLLIYKFTK